MVNLCYKIKMNSGEILENQDKIHKVTNHLNEIINELRIIFTDEYFNIDDFYFAGGCIYSLWNDKEIKDYDIFCKNKKAINKLRKWFRKNKDEADFITKNAISMGKYQFVLKFIGQPNVEVGKFDFKHNMCYYDNYKLTALSGYEYLESNKLEFNSTRARDVLNIITRIPKFIERGMEISQLEILNILENGTRPTKYFSERSKIKQRQSGKKSGY